MSKYAEKERDKGRNWRVFFTTQFPKTLDNAKEQWHDEMRKELTHKLAAEVREFMLEKQAARRGERLSSTHRNSSARQSRTHSGTDASGALTGVSSFLKPAKWNYTEFEVNYDCLA